MRPKELPLHERSAAPPYIPTKSACSVLSLKLKRVVVLRNLVEGALLARLDVVHGDFARTRSPAMPCPTFMDNNAIWQATRPYQPIVHPLNNRNSGEAGLLV